MSLAQWPNWPTRCGEAGCGEARIDSLPSMLPCSAHSNPHAPSLSVCPTPGRRLGRRPVEGALQPAHTSPPGLSNARRGQSKAHCNPWASAAGAPAPQTAPSSRPNVQLATQPCAQRAWLSPGKGFPCLAHLGAQPARGEQRSSCWLLHRAGVEKEAGRRQTEASTARVAPTRALPPPSPTAGPSCPLHAWLVLQGEAARRPAVGYDQLPAMLHVFHQNTTQKIRWVAEPRFSCPRCPAELPCSHTGSSASLSEQHRAAKPEQREPSRDQQHAGVGGWPLPTLISNV